MSLVVSDTSPLRALHHLGEEWLLENLYGQVLVPPAVAAELSSPRGLGGPVDITTMAFVTLRAPIDQLRVQQFAQTLDPGEAEAITLAIEVHAAALLIDEAAGRAAAAASGLPFVGVLGILARSKREGRIADVRSRIDRLRSEIQFYLSDQLYEQFLKSIGE